MLVVVRDDELQAKRVCDPLPGAGLNGMDLELGAPTRAIGAVREDLNMHTCMRMYM